MVELNLTIDCESAQTEKSTNVRQSATKNELMISPSIVVVADRTRLYIALNAKKSIKDRARNLVRMQIDGEVGERNELSRARSNESRLDIGVSLR
jgi:hypothetical protein